MNTKTKLCVWGSAVLLPAALAFAAMTISPIADGVVLEPSVRNEVDHALETAKARYRGREDAWRASSTNAANVAFARLYETNGLNATAKAIALVSSQRADGSWFAGTNEVTAAAVMILRNL